MDFWCILIVFSISSRDLKKTLAKQESKTQINFDFEIYIDRIESHGNLTLYNCLFVSIRGDLLNGGAIFLKGHVPNIFSNCNFYNCNACYGGAIYMSSFKKTKSICQFCVFNNNYAFCKGGALDIQETNISLDNCQFINNHINKEIKEKEIKESGGIYFNYSNSNINNCIFSNNYVLSVDYGGFTGCRSGSLTFDSTNYCLNNCSFKNNSIICDEDVFMLYGGAIFSGKSYKSIINYCEFINNTIIANYGINAGAGIFSNGDSLIIIENNFFLDNQIINDEEELIFGGALNFLNSNSSIKNCVFKNNKAIYGCDIFLINDINLFCNISNCVFDQNTCNNYNESCLFGTIFGFYQHISFINNQVRISGLKIFYIFGSLDNSSFACDCSNNCIYPYENELLKMNHINVTDHTGVKQMQFKEVFNENCSILSSSFYESDQISNSLKFSISHYFTKSYHFSKSNHFSQSLYFSKSNHFSQSLDFSISNHFSQSLDFSISNHFSQSLDFNISNHFSNTLHFSISDYLTKSSTFYKSNQLFYSSHFDMSSFFQFH